MRKNPDGYLEAIREDLKNRDQFNRKVDNYFSSDDVSDVFDEMGFDDMNRLIGSLKIDDSY